MNGFSVCPHAVPCPRQPALQTPEELFRIAYAHRLVYPEQFVRVPQRDPLARRLDALMLRCREDAHAPTYADLLVVQQGP